VRAALAAVDPEVLVARAIGDDLRRPAHAAGRAEDPRGFTVIAAGKAAVGMATGAARSLGPRVRRGLVVRPGDAPAPAGFDAVTGGHPSPTAGSEAAGRRALEIARATRADEGLLVLLSGGASAMLAVPADPVTLAEKARTTDLLLRTGVDIAGLNAVRKHLSAIKGGQLAAASPAPSRTLAISDVVGDDLSVIGSGPTTADPTTFADALDVLRGAADERSVPPAVVSRLRAGSRGELPETPKPGDPRLARGRARVIGGRRTAMDGARAEAQRRGYVVKTDDRPVTGESRDAARRRIADAVTEAASMPRPCCLISSGETTVRVAGAGRGGRNQEFALAAAAAMPLLGNRALLASVGTDGVDGPTDAAGAIVDSSTAARAAAAGLAMGRFLDDNDSTAFFEGLGDLIRTGPTGTNVGDLQVILLA
jgi:hydroxypyruvate reductase